MVLEGRYFFSIPENCPRSAIILSLGSLRREYPLDGAFSLPTPEAHVEAPTAGSARQEFLPLLCRESAFAPSKFEISGHTCAAG